MQALGKVIVKLRERVLACVIEILTYSVRFREGNINNIHYIHVTFQLQRHKHVTFAKRYRNNLMCVVYNIF